MSSNSRKQPKVEERYYILRTERPGRLLPKGIIQLGIKYLTQMSTNCEPCYPAKKGEIFKDLPVESQPKDEHKIHVISVEKDNVILETSTGDLNEISIDVAKLLLPVEDHEERYRLYMKRTFTTNALAKRVGDPIAMEHDGCLICGKIKRIKDGNNGKFGTFFAVELEIEDVRSFSSGKKVPHKKCIDVVTTVDKLIFPTTSIHGQNDKSHSKSKKPGIMRVEKWDMFKVGMKVSVFIGDKILKGTIKFIGKAAHEKDMTFGVELESPDGNASGTFHGEKVMDCKPFHGVFANRDNIVESKFLEDDEHGNYVIVDDADVVKLKQPMERTEDVESKRTSERNARKSAVTMEDYGNASKFSASNAREEKSPYDDQNRTQDNLIEMNNVRKGSFPSQASISTSSYRHYNRKQGWQKGMPSGPPSLPSPNLSFDYSHYSDRSMDSTLRGHHHQSNAKLPRRGSDTALSAIPVTESSSSLYKKKSDSYDPSLQVDSVVQVSINGEPKYGLIRWIGNIEKVNSTDLIAGLELEEPCADMGDGVLLNKRYFSCPTGRAFFVKLSKCKKDQRFTSTVAPSALLVNQNVEELEGNFLPPSKFENVKTGRMRGIQGHHNSCYLDSTLFAMFAFSMVFDSVLYRKKRSTDIQEYEQVQNALKNAIVNPLRVNGFVNAASVLRLRGWLDKLANVPGFMNEEKDPEEFLMLLLKDVLQVDPFLLLRTNNNTLNKSYFYQILVDREEHNPLPTLQYLFELSFLTGSICLEEVPSVLVIQLPRSGLQKMYKRIRINPTLDVSNVMSHAPSVCFVCGKVAEYSCKECRISFGWDRPFVFFCRSCKDLFHQSSSRGSHQVEKIKKIETAEIFTECTEMKKLELFAVVCIQTSHYVTFAKCGDAPDDKWVFFDSMADRVGEEAGHNVPEIVECPEVKDWLNKSPLTFAESDSKNTPEKVTRLFEDASLCFYKSSGLSMYR